MTVRLLLRRNQRRPPRRPILRRRSRKTSWPALCLRTSPPGWAIQDPIQNGPQRKFQGNPSAHLSQVAEILFVAQQNDGHSGLRGLLGLTVGFVKGSLRSTWWALEADKGLVGHSERRSIRDGVDDDASVAVLGPVGRHARVLLRVRPLQRRKLVRVGQIDSPIGMGRQVSTNSRLGLRLL